MTGRDGHEARAVVEDYLGRLLAGASDADALFAPGATWWVAGQWDGAGTFTVAQVRSVAEASASWFAEPMRFSVRRIIADGDTVAVELHSDTVFRGGAPYSNDYVMIYEVRGGQIVSVREYLDTKLIADGLAALGERHPARAMNLAPAGNEETTTKGEKQ